MTLAAIAKAKEVVYIRPFVSYEISYGSTGITLIYCTASFKFSGEILEPWFDTLTIFLCFIMIVKCLDTIEGRVSESEDLKLKSYFTTC